MNKRIFLSSPHMGGKEQKYIQDAFDINYIAPLGPNVDGFEKELIDYTNGGACAALSSGTAAIHLALVQLGVEPDDEVICSSFTFSASANPILYQGAIPVFVDSEQDTWNMDPELLRIAIKDRIKLKGKKPKAIILVHLYGMPARMDEILAVSDDFEIPIIEDAAEALGSTYKNQHLGTFGKFGVFSFNGNKIITTSGGGALISKENEAIERTRFLATQAREDAPHYEHAVVGYNYRMSNVLAGIGRGQLQVLDKWVELRRGHNKWYKHIFKDIKGARFLSEPDENYKSNFWLTTLTIDTVISGFKSSYLIEKLAQENIESRPLWKPMHLQPVFKGFPAYTNGTAEMLFQTGVCLPSGSSLTIEEKNRIEKVITEVAYVK